MSGLYYREDADEVRCRLRDWWHGKDIGRPVLLISAPREVPAEDIPAFPKPEGWLTDYSTKDFAYRVNLAARACLNRHFLGEALPFVAPDLAPNCLALYLGCEGVEGVDTVWCKPCIDHPENARFAYNPTNFYWQFTLRLAHEMLRLGQGKFLVGFPDLIEGLDTLAAMRGNEKLLLDIYERPNWVHQSLCSITDQYFHYYDILYDIIRDEMGGSIYWIWAPGRVAKLQCDFSAMISPEMFVEFMVPVLQEMTERISYSFYHWDGPAALRHHDALLMLPRLGMIQWTPGTGNEPPEHPCWWQYYHKTIEAGKKVLIGVPSDVEVMKRLKREFRQKFHQFALWIYPNCLQQGEEILRICYD